MVNAAPNIDDRGVTDRLRRSLYSFAAALVIVAVCAATKVSWLFVLIAAVPFWGAFSLAYQGLFKT